MRQSATLVFSSLSLIFPSEGERDLLCLIFYYFVGLCELERNVVLLSSSALGESRTVCIRQRKRRLSVP